MFFRFATRSHQFDSDSGSNLHESSNGRLTVSKTVNLGPTPSSCATRKPSAKFKRIEKQWVVGSNPTFPFRDVAQWFRATAKLYKLPKNGDVSPLPDKE